MQFVFNCDGLVCYNLFGNPFSYNINWAEDVKITGMDAGYAVIKADGGYQYKNDGIIKVGEGFMVHSAKGRTHNITLQKGINSSKRNVEKNVNIIASGKFGSDNVIFNFENTESGFPKLNNINDKIANIFIMENDTVYGIYNYNNEVKEVPFYFDAKEMGNYTLSFDVKGEYENLYLIDKMTGEQVNMLIEKEYSFTATANDNPQRFVLKMDNSQQTADNSNFAYINNGELIVEVESPVQIIDMMGRVVMTEESHNGSINISSLKNAAYIVRCVSEDEVKTQKIVVL